MKRRILSFLLLITALPNIAQINCSDKIVAGYIPSYRNPATVDYSKLTHTYFCFIYPTLTGGIGNQSAADLSNMNTFLSLATNTTKLIVVGSTNFQQMATSWSSVQNQYSYHATFADTLRKYCQLYGFNGVDIDWEGLSSTAEANAYSAMITTLRDTLHKYGLVVVSTVGYGSYWGQYFTNTAVLAADWMQVMVYDQTGTWAASPYGNHSSFQHLLNAEAYWAGRGIATSHVVMGMPFYGYDFPNTSGGLAPAKTYNEIVNVYPYMDTCSNRTPCDDYTWFNGPALIRKKVNYSISKGFKGVFIWELGQDAPGTKSLLWRVRDEFNRACAGYSFNDLCTGEIEPCTTFEPEPETTAMKLFFNRQEQSLTTSVPPGEYRLFCIDGLGRTITQQYFTSSGYENQNIPLALSENTGVHFILVYNNNFRKIIKVLP